MAVAPSDSRSPVDSTVAVWLVSIAVHVILLMVIATSSGRWFGTPGTDDGGGGAVEPFRSVGVVEKPSPGEEPADPSDAPIPSNDPSDGPPSDVEGPVVPDRPPAALDLPGTPDRTIGAGHVTPPSRAPGDVGSTVRAGGSFDRVPVGGLAPGETRFFGIRDKGTRILYLIDISGSMGGAKLAAAKSQVLVSLETLTEKQQFQIVFYNQNRMPMKLLLPRSDPRQTALFAGEGVYLARSFNKTRTRQYLGSVAADGGTDREEAIKKALSYAPDVVYFLTDGDAVELDAAKRNRLVKLNDGRARIHCIEFGEGPAPTVRTPLKRLASENDGLYRFVPVGMLR